MREEDIKQDKDGRLVKIMYDRIGDRLEKIFDSEIRMCLTKSILTGHSSEPIGQYNPRDCMNCTGFEKGRECYKK